MVSYSRGRGTNVIPPIDFRPYVFNMQQLQQKEPQGLNFKDFLGGIPPDPLRSSVHHQFFPFPKKILYVHTKNVLVCTAHAH